MHAQYDEAHRQEVCCAPLPAADIGSSSRGSSQRPAGDPRRSPVPGNGGLWCRSVGSISRVERRGEAAEHRRSDCPEEVARMQPRVPPTMAAEQAGVSKIGSWWRLALGPPGGESGVADDMAPAQRKVHGAQGRAGSPTGPGGSGLAGSRRPWRSEVGPVFIVYKQAANGREARRHTSCQANTPAHCATHP